MMECHNLPTAKPYLVSGTLYSRVNGVRDGGRSIDNIVLYETEERVESGFVGIVRRVQISSTTLAVKPDKTAQLYIDGTYYALKDPVARLNPGFIPFWEAEIKAI